MADQENTQPINQDDSAVKATAGKTRRRKAPARNRRKPLPPWKVLLHNDDVNDFEDVVRVICQLTPLGMQDALLRTQEAHQSGVALLLTTHRERAELYVDQFASFRLTTTIEPAE